MKVKKTSENVLHFIYTYDYFYVNTFIHRKTYQDIFVFLCLHINSFSSVSLFNQ